MFKRCFIRTILTSLTLAGIVLMNGCGSLQRPLAPEGTAPVKTSKALPGLGLALMDPLTDTYAQGDAGLFSPSPKGPSTVLTDNTLEAHFPEYGDTSDVRVEDAYFTVENGSVDQDVLITMTAFSGSKVKDVRVGFSPDGLVFNRPATLTIFLNGSVNPDRLKAYHKSSDGTVTEVPLTLSALGSNRWQATLSVPGFSEYSLGDDWRPPEGGGP